MKKKYIVTIIILAAIFVVVGFSNTKSGEDHKLQIGLVLPMSGPAASLGEDFLRAFKIGYEESGADFDYYIEDSLSFHSGGFSATKKLLDTKNIDVLIGIQTPIALAMVPLAEQYDVPLIGAAIAEKDFALMSDHTFKLYPHDLDEGKLMADFVKTKGYERIGVITVNDAFGKSFNESFTQFFDGEVPLNEEFIVPTTDFRLQLSKLKNEDLDAIYFIGFPPHYVSFLKQRDELGVDIPILSITHLRSQVAQSLAKEYIKNAFVTTPLSVLENKDTVAFQNKYFDIYGAHADWNASPGYQSAFILNEVANNPTKEPIQSLLDLEITVLGETINFNELGETEIPLVVIDAETDEIVFEN